MSELKLVSLCRYLTGNLQRREDDWASYHMVQAVKGRAVRGTFSVRVQGAVKHYGPGNYHEFLRYIPRGIWRQIKSRIDGPVYIVPIPNSHVVSPATPDFRTFDMAKRVAAASDGQAAAVPALWFREKLETSSSGGGSRDPDLLHEKLKSSGKLDRPVVLFDDVYTSGGHMKAAAWKMEDDGTTLALAVVFARTTHAHEERPHGPEEEIIDLSGRAGSLF